jgi:hypothetical protein
LGAEGRFGGLKSLSIELEMRRQGETRSGEDCPLRGIAMDDGGVERSMRPRLVTRWKKSTIKVSKTCLGGIASLAEFLTNQVRLFSSIALCSSFMEAIAMGVTADRIVRKNN